MATFVDLILKGTKLDEAVKQQLADRVMHVVENCDKTAVLESARLDEANMIPSKREAVVAFATQHYNKTHGTNFPKHDVHAHLYGGEAPEFADHVEKHANPEAADHLEKNFGLKKNSFMEGEDPCWVGYEMIGTKTKDGDEVPNCVKEQEDAPDNAIPPLSKEAVKKLLTTYQKRNLPAEYNIDEFLPKSPEGAARASATAGEDVPPVAHPAGPSPQDAYKNWFTNQGA